MTMTAAALHNHPVKICYSKRNAKRKNKHIVSAFGLRATLTLNKPTSHYNYTTHKCTYVYAMPGFMSFITLTERCVFF